MPETNDSPSKPRLFLRIFLVILLLAATAGGLGYKKYLQIQVLSAQGQVPPAPISVTVAIATAEQWNKQIKAIGRLTANHGVEVSSEVAGVIASINFESGQEVQKGLLLVELDNQSELASMAAAKAKFSADSSQYQRLLKLKDQNFVTKNDLDTQLSLVDIAQSQIGVANAALAKKNINAPFSGKVGIRLVDVGEYIAPGTPIVTLQSVDKLLLDFTLPESHFKDLAVDQSIRFQVRSYPDRGFTAKVKAWNPVLDTNTGNITIRAEVDNKRKILAPGMFAELVLRSSQLVPVLTVPETAIFYNIYGETVYVLEKPDASKTPADNDYRLAMRQVKVAYRNNGKAGIGSGIKAGDQVVTSGQLKLYPSLKVAIVDDVTQSPQSVTATQ